MAFEDEMCCLYTAEIDNQFGSYLVEIPENEIELGAISPGDTLRVALLAPIDQENHSRTDRRPEEDGSPVQEGERVEVEIDDIGEKGDGIARVGPGYIVFVPDTQIGDRVEIEITEARESFGFGDVVEGPY